MDPVVVDMHTSSGLLTAIAASTVTLEEAGAATLAFIKEHVPEAAHGAALRQLDRHRPALPGDPPPRDRGAPPLPLGRRVTIKELARRWYPGALDAVPRKATAHRALDDIRESIEELRWYREHVFKPSPEPTRQLHLTGRSSRFPADGRTDHRAPAPAGAGAGEHRDHGVAPGILRSQLPISLPGLGHVNCYFLEDERGVAIVDPGLPGPQSWRALVAPPEAGRVQAQARPHRDRHPLAPRPLRRRRPAARHLRRRGDLPPQLPHLVRPGGGRVARRRASGDGETEATTATRAVGPARCRGGTTPRSGRR